MTDSSLFPESDLAAPGTAAPAARPGGRLWSGWPLWAQVALVGVLLTAAATLAVRLSEAASRGMLFLMGGCGLLATAGAALWSLRVAGRLDAVAREAVLVRRADAMADRNFSLAGLSREWLRAERSLRRLVDGMRARQRVLVARNAELGQQLDQRTHTLSALQELSINLGAKSDVQGLIEDALDALEQTIEYDSASVWVRDTERARGQVVLLGYRSADPETDAEEPARMIGRRLSRSHLERYEQIERDRRPVIENRVRQSLLSWLWDKVVDDSRTGRLFKNSRSWMAVPLTVGDSVLGVLRVDHDQPDYFTDERVRLLLAVASQTALAVRHAQTVEQAREAAVVAERNRIARDLHDAVSQTLFAANVVAGNLARDAHRLDGGADDSKGLGEQARTLERLNRSALAEMRMLLYELRPDALLNAPMAELLRHAVTAICSRGDFDVELDLATDDGAVPPEKKVELYRMAQEALSNVARHSQARNVAVEWATGGPLEPQLRIADDGVGFDPDAPVAGHFGLENMRARADAIGARFTLASAPGMGTDIRIQLGKEPS